MIYTGIDMIEISRVAKSVKKSAFLNRVYGESEIREFKNIGMKIQSAAASFAAKEAFAKALGTGIAGFSLREVEVLHEDNGRPYLNLSGMAKRLAEEKNLRFSLSITHTQEYAAAIVIAYEE